MMTFSLNSVTGVDSYSAMVWDAINSNLGYFKSFNKDRWEEAVHRTYITALEHRDDSYGDVVPYIKKLARTILQIKQNESAYSVQTDDGEIAPIYYSLTDHIDTENLDGSAELVDTFKELYLLDTESFMKLKEMFKYNDVADIENKKAFKIRNARFGQEFRKLVEKFGADFTFKVLYDFFRDLPELCSTRQTGLIKDITLKVGNFDMLEKIPDTPLIVDQNNNYHYIDKNTLTMLPNPDYFVWDVVGPTSCDILKVDISPLLNYLYEEVYTVQGLSTRHITWCGDKYRVTTPGGDSYIGLDREKFIQFVRVELILNLMMNNVGAIVAISPDNVYIKPTRAFQFDTIRLRFTYGKIIDLPISLHIKKRKR